MLLAVDVGNTQTVLGLFDGEKLVEHWRVATESERTGDEVAALVVRLLELRDLDFEDVDGVCLASTVPLLSAPTRIWPTATRTLLSSWSGRARRRASRSSSTTRARSGPTGS